MISNSVNKTSLHPGGVQPHREHTELEEELHETAHIDYDHVAIVSASPCPLTSPLSMIAYTFTNRSTTPPLPLSTKMLWYVARHAPTPVVLAASRSGRIVSRLVRRARHNTNWRPKVYETGSAITDSGALTAYSGAKTGRSPLDKRIVLEDSSKDDIWWGPVNKPMTPEVGLLFRSFYFHVELCAWRRGTRHLGHRPCVRRA